MQNKNMIRQEVQVTMRNDDLLFSIDYLKNYLLIDNNDFDIYLVNTIHFAERYAEKILGVTLTKKVLTEDIVVAHDNLNNVSLSYQNVTSIDQVTLDDVQIDSGKYRLIAPDNVLILNQAIANGRLKIKYTAGFDIISEENKYAILNHVSYCYKYRNNPEANACCPDWINELYFRQNGSRREFCI